MGRGRRRPTDSWPNLGGERYEQNEIVFMEILEATLSLEIKSLLAHSLSFRHR